MERGVGPSLRASARALGRRRRLRRRTVTVTNERARDVGGSSIRLEVRRPGRSAPGSRDGELGVRSVRSLERGERGETGGGVRQFGGGNERTANEGRGDLTLGVLGRAGVQPELQNGELAAGLFDQDRGAVETFHADFSKLELEKTNTVRHSIIVTYVLVGELGSVLSCISQ